MGRNKIVVGILLLFLPTVFQANLAAQELIFEKRPDFLTDHPKFGPNRTHFYHLFISSALTLPATASTARIKTDQLSTGIFSLGVRYKLKITDPIAIVSECGISRNFFKVDQNPDKRYPDISTHHAQSIRADGLFVGVSLRMRLGQRGDYLGNYIDIGMTAETTIKDRLITKDFIYPDPTKPYQTEKTTVSDLDGLNVMIYKAMVRFGFDRFSLFASYRLSRLVESSSTGDLPGLGIGLEFSPVRY